MKLLQRLIALSLALAVLAACAPENMAQIIFCDRAVVRYVAGGDNGGSPDPGTRPYRFEVRLASNNQLVAFVQDQPYLPEDQRYRIEIPYGQTFPEGTLLYVQEVDNDQSDVVLPPQPCSADADEGTVEETWFDPGDQRINRQPYASVAVYCDMDNSRVGIYAINAQGHGVGTAFVPFSELPPVPTGGNTLIGERGGYSFHRLTSGEYQVMAPPDAEGKQYVVIFDGCPHTYLNAYILQNGVLTQTEAS